MKRTILLAVILAASTTLFGQTKWKVDKAHAKIGFSVKHMMLSEVEGVFKKFDATIVSSKEDFGDAVYEISIDAASVNTDNEKRDNDLRSSNYFDVAKYPLIIFKSTSVNKTGGKKYKVAGNLTIHGVTKPVTLELTLNSVRQNPATHKPIADFKVTGAINRTDFGVGDVPKAMIGYEINLVATGEFVEE